MTYVEFFDKTDSENIVACLSHAPSRVVFVGDNSKRMKRHVKYYQKIFAGRGQEIEFVIKTVSKSKLADAVARLTEIVNEYGECAFDITGGDELLTLALGIVYAQNKEKNIQIHRFNLKNNSIYDCDMDGKTIFQDVPMLSVEENIRAYCGEVVYGDVDSTLTYRWEWDEVFLRDIERMWTICKENPHRWNAQTTILGGIVLNGKASADGLTYVVSKAALEKWKYKLVREGVKLEDVAGEMINRGLLRQFSAENTNRITVTFKNQQVKKCLTKAGLVLELKTYLMAQNLRDEDGNPVYQDMMNGVVIDWDNAPYEGHTETGCDTRNEVDLVMMHGVVPVFISCKNGKVNPDELYKFNTIAERFGGEYAQKALVLGPNDAVEGSVDHFRQRARDMGIQLIEDVQNLPEEDFAKKLKNLWSK